MSYSQIEQMKKYYGMKKNKERLIQMMKKGQFVELNNVKGFIYAVKIGESYGENVMMKVAMKNGNIEIMDTYNAPLTVANAA